MTFLACLAGAAAMSASALSERWRSGAEARFTIHVAARADDAAAAHDARADRVAALLIQTPGVADARRVPREEVAALLGPWLGGDQPIQDLPLPHLIDVEALPDSGMDSGRLEATLAPVGAGVGVEDHGAWLADLVRLADGLRIAGLAVVALVAIAGAAIVAFATRAGFAMHRDVVEVLHIVGAQDAYIAKQFERRAGALALRGGAFGLAAAAILLGAVAWLAAQVDPGLTPMIAPGPLSLALLSISPLVAAGVARATARLAALRDLQRLS